MSECPSREQLALLLAEQLGESETGRVEAHLEACPRCQEVLAGLCGSPLTPPQARPGPDGPPRGDGPSPHFFERLKQAVPCLPDAAGSDKAVAPTPTLRAGPARPARQDWPHVPGYEIQAELGRGGMGVVYLARQVQLHRLVALKMILAGSHAGEHDLARFRTEAEAAARLQHPNIVQIHEIGEADGHPFFSLEFVEGGSLASQLDGTPLVASAAARLVETLARAIHVAHGQGIIHRDLKPANVLLTAAGAPKITDFGLAKKLDASAGPTASGAVMGTPSYMAPEQARGQSKVIGPAADVYALGAILYECLTGRPPFKAATQLDTMLQVLSEEPVAVRQLQPKVPVDLETIALKCLQKEPSQRYGSAAALAEDLRRFQAGEPIAARPVGRLERLVKWVLRRPALAAALTAGMLAVVGLAVGGVWWQRATEQQQRADEQQQIAREMERLRDVAEEKQIEADKQRTRAEGQERLVHRLLYFSHIEMADRAWQDVEIDRMDELLQGLRPEQTGGEDLRGFEWHYLTRLRHSSLLTLMRTAGQTSVAFSPDGKHLASASEDHAVKVWDAQTGQEILTLKGHTKLVRSAAFSPDGKRLASGGDDGTLKVWDTTTGHVVLSLKGRTGTVTSVAFSPDGKRLAGGSYDRFNFAKAGELRVWDAVTGQEALSLQGNTGAVTSLAFSPDGKWLAGGSGDQFDHYKPGELKVWDVATGQQTLTLRGHAGLITSVAFSPDGQRLASASDDEMVKVWDVATGQETLTLKGHTRAVNNVAFSPDGQRLASASWDKTVKVWNAATGRMALTLKGHTWAVFGVSFSPDGQRLASASGDGTVKVWDATASQEAFTFKAHTAPVYCVAFSPDGRRLASGSGDTKHPGSGGEVKVWDTATGRVTLSLKGHTKAIWCVAFSPDGQRLASASWDQMVKIWDAQTGQEIRTLKGHTSVVGGVAFSRDGQRLASAAEDGTLKVWDAFTGLQMLSFRGDSGALSGVAFSPDGQFVASASRDKSGGKTVKLGEMADGRLAIIVSGSKTVKVWNTMTGQGALPFRGHTGGVSMIVDAQTGREVPATLLDTGFNSVRVAFSPDGKHLASAWQDVKVWDVATCQVTLTLEKKGTSGYISLAFSPDGQRLAVGGHGTVEVWDVATGLKALGLKGHTGKVFSLAFSPDGKRLASASADGTVKVWDAATGK
jgi:WD40 repeat protein